MLGSGSLVVKLATAIIAILMSAAALATVLNLMKFSKIIEDQEARLYSFVVADISDTLERALALGLPLEVLSNAQQVIDRRRVDDTAVVRVSVVDAKGLIVFDTDRAQISQKADRGWGMPAAGQTAWRGSTAAVFLVSTPIVNTFGQAVGWVVLAYERAVVTRKAVSILHSMLSASLIAISAGSVLAILGVWLLARRLRALWVSAEQQLSQAQLDTPVSAEEPSKPPGDEIAVASFVRRSQSSLRALKAGEKYVETLLVQP
ncbi:MAG: hypothetical protein Q8O26_03035 [Phreatobacter sp.]|uniref:hypothetical protein n=1 Tax=Phreatobacter sp. TaxID=1966341 RepID=UPI0027372715|nr:hypothetical protein [Phreatobacter sp.]MDP2800833.1 hypothetical protein [Phreatobacter sp.]